MSIYAYIFYANTSTQVSGGSTYFYADVYIGLKDSATNQPVNGNNIAVTYKTIEDNVDLGETTVYIPGQSLKIYSGLIHVSSDPGNPV